MIVLISRKCQLCFSLRLNLMHEQCLHCSLQNKAMIRNKGEDMCSYIKPLWLTADSSSYMFPVTWLRWCYYALLLFHKSFSSSIPTLLLLRGAGESLLSPAEHLYSAFPFHSPLFISFATAEKTNFLKFNLHRPAPPIFYTRVHFCACLRAHTATC